MVCFRPFDFEDDYVFASEITNWAAEVTTSGVIKAPPGSPLMEFAWETCLSKDPQEIQWGETGPRLMQEAVAKFHLVHFRKPYFAMLFEKLVEQHRVHRVVTHAVDLTLLVASHQVGVDLFHLLSYQPNCGMRLEPISCL